jgi:hypothetical protein
MCLLAGSLADAMPTPSMRSRLCSRRVFAVAAHPAVADGPLQARFCAGGCAPVSSEGAARRELSAVTS